VGDEFIYSFIIFGKLNIKTERNRKSGLYKHIYKYTHAQINKHKNPNLPSRQSYPAARHRTSHKPGGGNGALWLLLLLKKRRRQRRWRRLF
jgi:hypothetical protein